MTQIWNEMLDIFHNNPEISVLKATFESCQVIGGEYMTAVAFVEFKDEEGHYSGVYTWFDSASEEADDYMKNACKNEMDECPISEFMVIAPKTKITAHSLNELREKLSEENMEHLNGEFGYILEVYYNEILNDILTDETIETRDELRQKIINSHWHPHQEVVEEIVDFAVISKRFVPSPAH